MDGVEELIPYTQRVQIANASHIMHEDNASYFNREVLSFLKKYS
jgi:pimeloyl-ACP methyl ester carboxylesterase